jgi:hypothetical protein
MFTSYLPFGRALADVPVITAPAPSLLESALAVMVVGERLPAAGWAAPLSPLPRRPHPPRQGSHPPVPHAAVFDLALDSTGYDKWPAGQARRPAVPAVKVANPYPGRYLRP